MPKSDETVADAALVEKPALTGTGTAMKAEAAAGAPKAAEVGKATDAANAAAANAELSANVARADGVAAAGTSAELMSDADRALAEVGADRPAGDAVADVAASAEDAAKIDAHPHAKQYSLLAASAKRFGWTFQEFEAAVKRRLVAVKSARPDGPL